MAPSMKSSSSLPPTAPPPKVQTLYIEYLKAIQSKLSSLILFLLALSTILILFLLHPTSTTPFTLTFTLTTINQHNNTSSTNTTTSSHKNNSSSAITHTPTLPAPTAPSPSELIPIQHEKIANQTIIAQLAADRKEAAKAAKCDLFTGKWVRDARGSIYTNTSCATLPDLRNCGKYGKDQGYVYWRWKPEGCELPIFDPGMFLSIARGKKLMFIGDSLARNQMESLLCLLSQAETPIDTYRDAKDKHRTWYFPVHDFTLMVIWTEFLVETSEIIINGTPSDTFNITLDRMNPLWATKLPELSYAVINGGNWFTRKTYIYEHDKLIACVHCQEQNVPHISAADGVRMIFRSAFHYISQCQDCRDELLAVLRTYSMSHFEHGSWLDGGYCNRTRPLSEGEVSTRGDFWRFREIQLEERERVNKREGNRRRIGLLDVTKAMVVRADAHPGKHWIAKSTNDCLHWCLPGPIDAWNELLLEVIKRNDV